MYDYDAYDAYDAAADAAADAETAAEESLREHCPGFVWRERIACALARKVQAGTATKKDRRDLDRFNAWLSDAINEEMAELADAADLARDPYSYYGVSRSDFC